jgi:ATP-dependent protease ClpP protease subunit
MDRPLEPHLLRLESDRAVVRLLVPLDRESVFALVDELELLQSYYRYRRISLEIDSPGGEATALQYLVDRLYRWRNEQRLVLSTRALSSVSSAAAIILSMGSHGHRHAHASARLLYHSARARAGGGEFLTRPVLKELSSQLEQLDQTVTRQLAQNAFPTDGERPLRIRIPGARHEPEVERTVSSVEELERIYSAFFERDHVITPAQAVGLGLIDTVEEATPEKGAVL